MWDNEQSAAPDDVPEEAREYAQAIVAYQDHPVVRDYFHQITLCQLPLPTGGVMPFFVLEFRSSRDAALVWNDGHGNWGVGDWQALAAPDEPFALDIAYFQDRPAAASFAAALEQLRKSRPSVEPA